ncbi:hypothetical protein ASPWEDRAFT_39245 [Aspergillus wentii DTO 134E9]|uniref:Uncharacterized protein n=1 Tax=Aspergillus wentii DTO 134E9 TaxID=1073089 RepID=A0A1L9RRL6_ASPWE|nr:uncharacterized protein ASPWEDRAFT_39245 [Aspergillus wentii DTO 134E9]KAI9930386.1 hypothetical protein MW887_011139 [Aspergillus wentii]OJJ37544.1 hypothetical protein ASPWEDRAFT_39245 [Aspergillus wentii DTO 134E9]
MAETPFPNKLPPYTPMSSLGHELGVMFGFMAACFVIMAVYTFIWRAAQRRNAEKDLARRKNLQAKGVMRHRDGNRVHEKMVDRHAIPANRAELPVHQAG